MIPSEGESLQDQLTEGSLEVEEFFAILLSTYEFDASKEWNIFNPSLHLSHISNQTNPSHVSSVQLYRDFSTSMCSHSLHIFTPKQFLMNCWGLNVQFLSCTWGPSSTISGSSGQKLPGLTSMKQSSMSWWRNIKTSSVNQSIMKRTLRGRTGEMD